jgi:hypothetical protein
MGKIHIHSPEVKNKSFRVLPKYKRQFVGEKFSTLVGAFTYGIKFYQTGFRVFLQSCYEWYDPTNKLIIKVENIKGVKENKMEYRSDLEELQKEIDALKKEIEFMWKYIEGDQSAIGAKKISKILEGGKYET